MGLEGFSESMAANDGISSFESNDDLAKAYLDLKTQTGDFSSQLPEDLRESEHFKDIKDVGTLAKSFAELRGQTPVVPKSIDEYQVDLPQGVELSDEQTTAVSAFKQMCLDNKVSPEAFKAVMEFDIGRTADMMQKFEDAAKETLSKVQSETRLTEEQISERLTAAAKLLGWDKLIERIDLRGDESFVKGLLRLHSDVFTEDQLRQGVLAPGKSQVKRADDGTPVFTYKALKPKE